MKKAVALPVLLLSTALIPRLGNAQFATRLGAQSPMPGTTLVDSDGDGVPDDQDCAPNDPRIAKPHTYYFDLDGDTFGDSKNTVSFCTVTPYPGTVVWGTDPDDSNNRINGPIVAKGQRTLGLDFVGSAQNGAWRSDLARELGAEAAPISVTWDGLETSPGVFNGPQSGWLRPLADSLNADSFQVNLNVSPFMQTNWTLPPDILAGIQSDSMRLSDPAVIARFNMLLDYVYTQLDGAQLTSLQIGNEIDLFFPVRPDVQFWADFSVFFRAAQAHAKSLWGQGLPVGITATQAGLVNQPTAALMQQLNAGADIVSLTYFPRTATFQAIEPAGVQSDIEQVIQAYYPKPIYVQSAGYPSSARIGSSTTRQSQFMYAMFEVWDAYPALIPYVGFSSLHDPSPATAASEASATYLAVPPAQMADATAYFATLGLRTYSGNGEPKSAYYTLRGLALNRGWWRVRPPATRSFLVGFTTAPYDGTPGGPMIDSVTSYTGAVIGAIGDMISFHFDGGVPWVEAYNDTFSSSTPPYSANVLDVWSKNLASRPAGTKMAVAINPLGIPRNRLAAYWGVGGGYYLDSNFNEVPTGVIQDYQSRLLPSPWDTYTLDAPPVKTAYLNYCRRVLDYFQPDYLLTGIEVNLAVQTPAVFAQYVALQQYVYTQLRANHAYDRVKIAISFTSEQIETDEFGSPVLIDVVQQPNLAAQNLSAIQQLLPYMDVVGLSIYPAKTRFGTYEIPAATIDNVFGQIRGITNQPIAITETGYPAASFTVKNLYFPADATKQAAYLKMLFADVQKWGNVEFVTNFSVRDQAPFIQKLQASALWTPPFISADLADFFNYFEYIGLFDSSGNARPAASLWVQEFGTPLQKPAPWSTPVTLTSPGGNVQASVGSDANGHLFYTAALNGQTVLESSLMGITVDDVDLGSSVTNVDLVSSIEVKETYPVRGTHQQAANHGWEYVLNVRRAGAGDLEFPLVVRVYDDGVAYRYGIPGQTTRTISGETSAWQLPEGTTLWFQDNIQNYESTYWQGEVGQISDKIGGPVTFQLPNGGPYLTLTEGALRHYSGMTFHADFNSRVIRSQFADDSSWTSAGGSSTPWRLAIIGATLTELVNSDMVTNVSAPPDPTLFPQGMNTPWIKPGRALWSWWSDQSSPGNFQLQMQYVDYAAQLRFEYVTVDSGWEAGFPANGEDQFARLADLVRYAQSKDINVWVWKAWSELADPATRQVFFAAVKQAGAVGVKIDNIYGVNSESVQSVQMYEDILRDAASVKLMVDFHGCDKPTGLSRTYPNEITREGVMGLEADALWQYGIFVPPHHDAVVPFTRMVAGPGDLTPLTVDPRKLGNTTFTHQLATSGIFTSPLQHVAENPQLLLAQPLIQNFLRMLPTVWDDTLVLPQSVISKVAVVARRKFDRWYLLVVSGDEANPMTLSAVQLSFLGAGQYSASMISDASPTSFAQQSQSELTSDSTMDINLLAGGGFVAVFSPQPDTSRQVPLGFISTPPSNTGAGWTQLYTTLMNHGNVVEHRFQTAVPWVQAQTSSNYTSYPQSLQVYWNMDAAADQAVVPGAARVVALTPIDTTTYTGLAPYWNDSTTVLPFPWNQYALNDPAVKSAYLNYARAAISVLQPKYLALDVDANVLLATSPGQWMAFRDLINYVYTGIKLLYPNVVVFSSIHYEDMLGLTDASRSVALQVKDSYPDVLESEIKALMTSSDLFAISSTPYLVPNNRFIGPGGQLDADYFDRAYAVAQQVGKPLAFENVAASSQPLTTSSGLALPGSEDLQNGFVTLVLNNAYSRNTALVVNFLATDYGTNYGSAPATLNWAYTGLYRQDGTAKPALNTWDSYRTSTVHP